MEHLTDNQSKIAEWDQNDVIRHNVEQHEDLQEMVLHTMNVKGNVKLCN